MAGLLDRKTHATNKKDGMDMNDDILGDTDDFEAEALMGENTDEADVVETVGDEKGTSDSESQAEGEPIEENTEEVESTEPAPVPAEKGEYIGKTLTISMGGHEYKGLCTSTRIVGGGTQVFLQLNANVTRYFAAESISKVE